MYVWETPPFTGPQWTQNRPPVVLSEPFGCLLKKDTNPSPTQTEYNKNAMSVLEIPPSPDINEAQNRSSGVLGAQLLSLVKKDPPT